MARHADNANKPTFHTPMRFDWTDEKLQTLSQEQLLNLLDNLDRQRAIGRVSRDVAGAVEPRIVSLLTARNGVKRRKQLAKAAAQDAEVNADAAL
jgi:hypothetical protein